MALLNKKEFAARCGMNTKALAVFIKRGKVELSGDNIDDTALVNIAFFQMRESKGKTGAMPAGGHKAPVSSAKPAYQPKSGAEDEEGPDENGILPLKESVKREKHFSAIKTEQEVKVLEIKADKLNGLVVPTDLVKTLVANHSLAITHSFKHALDDIITIFSTKFKLSSEECSHLRKNGIDKINIAVKSAIKTTVDSLDDIVNEYSLSRGVGEKN